MKILHTADWHIGKVLHKHSLQDEMELFLEWLLVYIDSEGVDVLLVSGDIFDIANPAVKDRAMYYGFLSKLIGKDIQVVITGGNHDSIGMLDAPQEILENINIYVVGGAKENIAEELIVLKNKEGENALVVAAVPFLRDKDLRNLNDNDASLSRTDQIKAGIESHYKELAVLCEHNYPDMPAIAMGHLYATGVSTSESERDIHIGNAAAVESNVFSSTFGYVALGHIHRPQVIGGNDMIRYSGSPIPLSFSEKEDKKCVIEIDLEENKFSEPAVVYTPKNRELKKVKGTYAEVKEKLDFYSPEYPLPSFVEIEVIEEEFSAANLALVEELSQEYSKSKNFKILKSKTHFLNGAKDTSDLFEKGANIEDLKPQEVFEKRLEQENFDSEKAKELREAFLEIFENLD